MNRRGFLAGILASAAAPAIAKSGVLMPVKPLWHSGGIVTIPLHSWSVGEGDVISSMQLRQRAFDKFETVMLRQIADGLGLSHEVLTGSVERPVYSSARILIMNGAQLGKSEQMVEEISKARETAHLARFINPLGT